MEPIHGYSVHYKPEYGDWDTVQVPPQTEKYTLEKLLCGTRYQVYVNAYNRLEKTYLQIESIELH